MNQFIILVTVKQTNKQPSLKLMTYLFHNKACKSHSVGFDVDFISSVQPGYDELPRSDLFPVFITSV